MFYSLEMTLSPSDELSGTLTFLFTDIEGSTKLWEADEVAMRVALTAHDEVLRTIVEAHSGTVFKHTGDGMCCVFASPTNGVAAPIEAQRQLELPVRMGVATGEVERRSGDYFGPILNRVARIMSAGHGGQIVLSASTANLISRNELMDLGPCRLRDLSETQNLYQVVAEGLQRVFPPLRTLDAIPGNLPQQTTSFVGRGAEIATVRELLSQHRLVTLVGVGGVGKTRLAIQSVADGASDYRDGVWMVELAPIADGEGLTEAIASVFLLSPQAGGTWESTLIEFLSSKSMLLLLDNCEHLLEELSPLVSKILSRCIDVKLVATSREALGVPGEWMWPVPSLETGPDSAATELFVERARAAAPEFVAEGSIDLIVEICRRLDAIPLAIELAAARVRSMSAEQIRDRLDERFRLLTGTRRKSDRHQTLRTAVQWSYDLLDETEKRVLQFAATFSDGFLSSTLAAVYNHLNEEIDEYDMLDLIDSLLRKSLVQTQRIDGSVRFSLLETIRQFAEEYLAESGVALDARDFHAAHFAELSQQNFAAFRSPREPESYVFINHEISNLRAAFRWSRERGLDDHAIIIAACSHEVARFALRTETYEWCLEVVDIARAMKHPKLPLLLTMASDSAWAVGRLEEAKALGIESIATSRSGEYEPFLWACGDLAQIALFEGDVERAYEVLADLAADELDGYDRFGMAFGLYIDVVTGREMTTESVAERVTLCRGSAMKSFASIAVGSQALFLAPRDVEKALTLAQEAIAMSSASGNTFVHGMLLSALGDLLREEVAQWDSFQLLLDKWSVSGDTMVASALVRAVVVLVAEQELEDAMCLHAILARGISFDTFVDGLPAALSVIRDSLGKSEYERIASDGAALSLAEGSARIADVIARAKLREASTKV